MLQTCFHCWSGLCHSAIAIAGRAYPGEFVGSPERLQLLPRRATVPGVHGGNGWSSLFDRRSLPVVRGHEIHQRSTLQARCPGCDPFGIDRPVDSPGRLPTWLPRPGPVKVSQKAGWRKVLTWIIALVIIVAGIVYLIIRHYRNRDSSGPPTGGGYIGM